MEPAPSLDPSVSDTGSISFRVGVCPPEYTSFPPRQPQIDGPRNCAGDGLATGEEPPLVGGFVLLVNADTGETTELTLDGNGLAASGTLPAGLYIASFGPDGAVLDSRSNCGAWGVGLTGSAEDGQSVGGGIEVSCSALVILPAGAGAVPADSQERPSPASATEPAATADGGRVAIFAGDCDGPFSGDPVATLGDVTVPTGSPRGDGDAAVVATSFSTLDVPLDDLLDEDHALVAFDVDDDTVPVVCGVIGGTLADEALSLGLRPVDGSGTAGIAYLTPDGDGTAVTVFLAEDLVPAPEPSSDS
jgi:hypothetical protein